MPTRSSLMAHTKSGVKYLPVMHPPLTDELHQIEKLVKIYKLLIEKAMDKHTRDLAEWCKAVQTALQ